MTRESGRFVGRGGDKLDAALDAFGIEVRQAVCADFGCNVGGFTDCLLARGASRVYALDTGYGQLAWRLRRDPRVVVLERTNALHCPAPEPVDLVVVDVGWTPQEHVLPAAARWLKTPEGGGGQIVSLLKPHYELAKQSGAASGAHRPRKLAPGQSEQICEAVCRGLPAIGLEVRAVTRAVIVGKGGNREFLLWVTPRPLGRGPCPADGLATP